MHANWLNPSVRADSVKGIGMCRPRQYLGEQACAVLTCDTEPRKFERIGIQICFLQTGYLLVQQVF